MSGNPFTLASVYLKRQELSQKSAFASFHHRSRIISKVRHRSAPCIQTSTRASRWNVEPSRSPSLLACDRTEVRESTPATPKACVASIASTSEALLEAQTTSRVPRKNVPSEASMPGKDDITRGLPIYTQALRLLSHGKQTESDEFVPSLTASGKEALHHLPSSSEHGWSSTPTSEQCDSSHPQSADSLPRPRLFQFDGSHDNTGESRRWSSTPTSGPCESPYSQSADAQHRLSQLDGSLDNAGESRPTYKLLIDRMASTTFISPTDADHMISRICTVAIHTRDDESLGDIVRGVCESLLRSELTDAARERLVKLIDELIVGLDVRMRPHTHLILAVTEPLLLDDRTSVKDLGKQAITHLIECVGLATVLLTISDDAKHDDSYVRRCTSETLALTVAVHGFGACNPYLKALCNSRHWAARCSGMLAVRSVATIWRSKKCHIPTDGIVAMVDLVEPNLSERKGVVRKAATMALIAIAELSVDFLARRKLMCNIAKRDFVGRSLLRDSIVETLRRHLGQPRAGFLLLSMTIQAFCNLLPLMPSRRAQLYLDRGLSDIVVTSGERSVALPHFLELKNLKSAVRKCFQCRGLVFSRKLIEMRESMSRNRSDQLQSVPSTFLV